LNPATQVSNLTTMEIDALTDLDDGLNLTDGHARLGLTEQQRAIVAQIPEMFTTASSRGFPAIEYEAHSTFLRTVGQHSAPIGTGRILSCYSSTLATDIVARALPSRAQVALLHPTFDNIADLLITRGLSLVPLSETELLEMAWPVPPVSVIFVTHPNNPTGLVMPKQHLESLAEHAARHGQLVIIDASFRGQVREAQYDCYEVLDAAGTDWILIEDTGKLWPTHELKIGMLAFSERTTLPIERAFSESLLAASPVVLQFVALLAQDWADGGYERFRTLIDTNRESVRRAVEAVGLALADPDSRISVARIDQGRTGPDSSVLHKELLSRRIHVLPCAPFYWASPDSGLRYIRVSLARSYEVVSEAAQVLADAYRNLSSGTLMPLS
jgi:aspartate/methionine/tyrosine aminotransferase